MTTLFDDIGSQNIAKKLFSASRVYNCSNNNKTTWLTIFLIRTVIYPIVTSRNTQSPVSYYKAWNVSWKLFKKEMHPFLIENKSKRINVKFKISNVTLIWVRLEKSLYRKLFSKVIQTRNRIDVAIKLKVQ